MATRTKTIGNRIAPPRFLLFIALFAVAAAAIQGTTGVWHEAIMGGFDVAATVFLVSLWPLLRNGDAASIRAHAAQNDANRPMLLVMAAVISAVLTITIWVELSSPGKPLAALIIATLALAWFFGNMIYALHYAHLFYGERYGGSGLTFPDTEEPDYWDFVYFSFTLGMTFQTSDIEIGGRTIRRVVLAQSVVAFVFNIGILAFTINTLGGG